MNFWEFKKMYQKKEVEEFANQVFPEPMVSICVQTYQHVNYIRECLDGILMQKTSFPFEILLGDDDSTDGTREICVEYAEKYPEKIRLFLHSRENNIKINGNPTGRFNFLFNLYSLRGKYIALCEGDDYWTDPLKLQKQVDFLEENENYGICFHNVAVLFEEEKKMIQDDVTRRVANITGMAEMAQGNFIHTPSVLFRNDFIIPEWFYKSPLGDWTLYMIVVGNKKIRKLEEVMAVYRVHNEGIWSSRNKQYRIKNTIKAFELIQKNLKVSVEIQNILQNQVKKYRQQLIKSRSEKLMLIFKKLKNRMK